LTKGRITATGGRYNGIRQVATVCTQRFHLTHASSGPTQMVFRSVQPFSGDRLQNGSPYAMGPLSCLSVCNAVYCGQTVGWIKMPLGTEVGFGPGDNVLDGNGRPSQQLLSSCCTAHGRVLSGMHARRRIVTNIGVSQ